MRIFLDVGAHTGETLVEVMKPEYRFDRIVAFEPSEACLPALRAFAQADPRVEICQIGLSDRTTSARLFQAGSEAGSVLGELDENPAHGSAVETIELVETAQWLRDNTSADDLVVMKTNCEGSEVAIVSNLLDTDMLSRLYALLITFDIRMYPNGLRIERALRKRLAQSGAHNFSFSDDVMIGPTHERRIHHWLHLFGVDTQGSDVAALRQTYDANFKTYATKSGLTVQAEHWIKSNLSYARFPAPVRRALQAVKRTLGLNRERIVHD